MPKYKIEFMSMEIDAETPAEAVRKAVASTMKSPIYVERVVEGGIIRIGNAGEVGKREIDVDLAYLNARRTHS